MPPKSAALSGRWWVRNQTESLFLFCPSCSQRLPRKTVAPSVIRSIGRRRISSQRPTPDRTTFVSSSSTVNAAENVPARFTALYKALAGVRDGAGNHVNASRLQLALRGLETEKPRIRVAVLGFDGTAAAAAAARLVRLLLADPLGAKAEWEDYLENYRADKGGGLLIKYGEKTEIGTADSFLPTIAVPSTLLKKSNLQIYLSLLGAGPDTRLTSTSLSVPPIDIPSPGSGNHSSVKYPVHRSIICGKGIDDLLAYNSMVGDANLPEAESVRAVFDMDMPQVHHQQPQRSRGVISFVNMDRAEAALETFRQSVQNASEYERGWLGSGMQPLLDWLSKDHSKEPIPPDVRRLVGSLLETAEESVSRQENEAALEEQAQTVSNDTRRSLGESVSTWSEQAHTELRDRLNEGFTSEEWRSLAWWKLFWRVDDVGMMASNILEKKWLPRAEMEAIWLSGKLQQAGLLSGDVVSGFNQRHSSPNEPQSTAQQDPWATHIGRHRSRLININAPSLHALAQQLVTFSVSTSTLSSALAALAYISTSTTSVYEAGTVAAIGLIYSLRRQQKRWDTACKSWESEVREEGRKALKDTEDAFQVVLRDGGRRTGSVTETEARACIEKAKATLSNVE